ncbi:MAG: DUF5320 domain-containing protein [Anaerotignum sp.]|nr:DUF5320 domain-containing protein [Anaerotignum sp.]
MPRRDGTGPMGMGAKTGRGAGFCTGLATKENLGGFGCGFGCGFGKGNGSRRMFHATGLPRWARFEGQNMTQAFASEAEEKELLEKQANLLERRLDEIKNCLAGFEENTEE